ncbi:MAG TPA: transposase [Allocoleopsis sp.]
MRIAGLDVSRGKVSCCVLSEIPEDLKRYAQKFKPHSFTADQEGIEALLALEFDGAVLEPTGHYSEIWAFHLEKAGRLVQWVGHWEVSAYRNSWRIANKSDKLDAIVLACYGVERWGRSQFFITPSQMKIRKLYLQLEHLNRAKNPVINRLRQELSHDFPEVATREVKRKWGEVNPPGLWRFLAGEIDTEKWRREWQRSIGIGIGQFTRQQAILLCQLERNELELESLIDVELSKPEFAPYLDVFDRYMIGNRTGAALLSTIYPIQQFLDEGKVRIDHCETGSGKRAGRNRSLAAFKLACGLGRVWIQSGSYEGWVAGGRADVRMALWRWASMAVVQNYALMKRRDKEIPPKLQELRDYYDRGALVEEGGEETTLAPGKGNQRLMRVVRRMLTSLFRDLVRECK